MKRAGPTTRLRIGPRAGVGWGMFSRKITEENRGAAVPNPTPAGPRVCQSYPQLVDKIEKTIRKI
jgi:hypothetical protein